MPETPYRRTDRTIQTLNRKRVKEFQSAWDKMSLLKFDELNRVKTIKAVYHKADRENREAFAELAELVALDVIEEYDLTPGKRDSVELVDQTLTDANPITGYSYYAEVLRKRDRVTEGISVGSIREYEWQKALRLWGQMSDQYADIVTDNARLDAFENSGVKSVMWNTQNDEKVCEECRQLDRKVFDIDKVPAKPHWRCRCYLTPVKG